MTDMMEETRPALTLGVAPGQDTLDAAKLAFGGARVALATAVDDLTVALTSFRSEAAFRADAEVAAGVRELSHQLGSAVKALTSCADQEAKARERWLDETGGGGIDLAAARAEVRGKLARLVPPGDA